jgi:anti-sigma-K factor RskA
MTPDQMDRIGQYVLGLLDGTELQQFERQLESDAELAAAVSRLQRHMLALDDTADALPANHALWASIAAQLDVTPIQRPADILPLPKRRTTPSGMLAIAASVIVALGIGYFAGSTTTGTRQPMMIAVLLNETDAEPGAIVEAFSDNSVRLVPLEDFVVPDGRILQVWTLPDPATGPVSLGTFSDPATIRLAGASLPPPANGQLYEITLEPAPGSPTGRPTGPVLVKGFARAPQ